MTWAGNTLVVICTLVCVAALGISIYPGLLGDLLIWPIVISILIAPIVALFAVISLLFFDWTRILDRSRLPWRQIKVSMTFLGVTFLLLSFFVPGRIAFAMSKSAFEQLVAKAPRPELSMRVNRRLGVYYVDEYAVDLRGGVYVRVRTGPDGIGPDTMSYGFAYKPNRQGSPYGAKYYDISYLEGNWYLFSASDDWF
jgi:hypothetical protein